LSANRWAPSCSRPCAADSGVAHAVLPDATRPPACSAEQPAVAPGRAALAASHRYSYHRCFAPNTAVGSLAWCQEQRRARRRQGANTGVARKCKSYRCGDDGSIGCCADVRHAALACGARAGRASAARRPARAPRHPRGAPAAAGLLQVPPRVARLRRLPAQDGRGRQSRPVPAARAQHGAWAACAAERERAAGGRRAGRRRRGRAGAWPGALGAGWWRADAGQRPPCRGRPGRRPQARPARSPASPPLAHFCADECALRAARSADACRAHAARRAPPAAAVAGLQGACCRPPGLCCLAAGLLPGCTGASSHAPARSDNPRCGASCPG